MPPIVMGVHAFRRFHDHIDPAASIEEGKFMIWLPAGGYPIALAVHHWVVAW